MGRVVSGRGLESQKWRSSKQIGGIDSIVRRRGHDIVTDKTVGQDKRSIPNSGKYITTREGDLTLYLFVPGQTDQENDTSLGFYRVISVSSLYTT